MAKDGLGLTSGLRRVQINVTDVNEPPIIQDVSISSPLYENSTSGSEVLTMKADDPDIKQDPASKLTYSLQEDFFGLFNMNQDTGTIRLDYVDALDYEQVQEYTLNITVRDNGQVPPENCATLSNGDGCAGPLSVTVEKRVPVLDVNDVAISSVGNPTSGAPRALDYPTTGGDFVQLKGVNFGTLPPRVDSKRGESYHVTAVQATVTASYGGDDGRMYEAKNCVIVERNTLINCATAPGAGKNLRWRVTVNGHESNLSPVDATLTYKSPNVSSVVIPDPGTLPTKGGATITLLGDNFGPVVNDCFGTIGGQPCPYVWYYIDYTQPLYPLNADTKFDDVERQRFDAVSCRIIDHTEISCETVPASGANIEWHMSIGGQEIANPLVYGNHTNPKLRRARYRKMTAGSCIDSSFDMTGGETTNTLDSCETICTATSGCEAIVWDASAPVKCKLKSSSLMVDTISAEPDASASRSSMVVPACSSSSIVYAPTIRTDGSDRVLLIGSDLGPAGAGLRRLSSVYGPSPLGLEPYAKDEPCVIVVPHEEISCPTVPGVGYKHTWQVRVGGQLSYAETSPVTTSYAIPILRSVTGVGAHEASTKGNETIVLSGANFGPVSSRYIAPGVSVGAVYGPFNKQKAELMGQGLRYAAEHCKVSVDYTTIECKTTEGTGKDHSWVALVGAQESPLLEANTSYAPPMVIKYTDSGSTSASTLGNQVVFIEGRNFGPANASLQMSGSRSGQSQPELVTYTNDLVSKFTTENFVFRARDCEVLAVDQPLTNVSEYIRCNTSDGAGAALQWTVVIDGQSSVQPTTNYDQPKVTGVFTDRTSFTQVPLSTEGGQKIFIRGGDFGPTHPSFLGDVRYGPTGLEYFAENCSITEHSTWIQCITTPGIGESLYFTVNVLGQQSEISTAKLSYASPAIALLAPSKGSTSGGQRMRLTGTDFAIRDRLVQKYVSWFDGDREKMVEILAQRGRDFELEGFTLENQRSGTDLDSVISWVAFDQPQGYGRENEVSVVLISSTTGERVQSSPVNFTYEMPSIDRVYPEEPYDCATKISAVVFGQWRVALGAQPVEIVLAKDKLLTNGSKVKITGWEATYKPATASEVLISTDLLVDTFTAESVVPVPGTSIPSSGATYYSRRFTIMYRRQAPDNLSTKTLGHVQVRRKGIRLKIEGRNFCNPFMHPAASPSCGRIAIAVPLAGTGNQNILPETESFVTTNLREAACVHTHNSLEVMSIPSSGYVRVDTWDSYSSKPGNSDEAEPVFVGGAGDIAGSTGSNGFISTSPGGGSSKGVYLMSEAKFFDQKTPQIDSVYRQRLTNARYRALSFTVSSNGVAQVDLGSTSSRCIFVGAPVTIENAVDGRLNGAHTITSLPPDSSSLFFTFKATASPVIPVQTGDGAGQQPKETLIVSCPGFQTHGVDVLTLSGTFWPPLASQLEVIIGDTPSAAALAAAAHLSATQFSNSNINSGNSRRLRNRASTSRFLSSNTTVEDIHERNREALLKYANALSQGMSGTKCVLTAECIAERTFKEDPKACLKLVRNELEATETFSLRCIVPAGAGTGHPVVLNRLSSDCSLIDTVTGKPNTQLCSRNTPDPISTQLSSLKPLDTNVIMSYSHPYLEGMYAASVDSQGQYLCDSSKPLILESDSADLALLPPIVMTTGISASKAYRVESPTEGMLACFKGKNFGNRADQFVLKVGHWTDDFPAYQSALEHTMHANGKTYDTLVFQLPPGDGFGSQNRLSFSVGNVEWPFNADLDPWWILDVQYEAPTLLSVEPKVGPAQGFEIRLSGINFGPSKNPALPKILVGKSLSSNALTKEAFNCTVPADLSGTAANNQYRTHTNVICHLQRGIGRDLDVSILINGQEHTLERAISYEPPRITSVSPSRVHTVGGDIVTITGVNFGSKTSEILLLSAPCSNLPCNHPEVKDMQIREDRVRFWNDTVIKFIMPPGFGAKFRVQITAGAQNSAPSEFSVLGYLAPSIHNVTLGGTRRPCTSMIRNEQCGRPTTGGFLIAIAGKDFSAKSLMLDRQDLFAVTLETKPRPSVLGWCGDGQTVACVVPTQHSHHRILVYMPSGIGTELRIRVRVGNQMDGSDGSTPNNADDVGNPGALFSYDAPWINTITPREGNAGSIGHPDGNRIKIEGINFGTAVVAMAAGDAAVVAAATDLDDKIRVFVGEKECLNAVKLQESGQPPHIECTTQRDVVGYKSVSLVAARQNVTYAAEEWVCDALTQVCGGEFKGGKQLFMMQCEDSTYGIFGEWCVDCPHVTDAISINTAADSSSTSASSAGGVTDIVTSDSGCSPDAIGSDVCVKSVLRNGKLDYIAECPTGSARFEMPAGDLTEAYDEERILEKTACASPDAYFQSENVKLACAPYPSAGFYKFYTNATDDSPKQIARSRCHSLRQPPGGTRQACSYIVSCEPRSACYPNNVCALDNDEEGYYWNSRSSYKQGDFVMMSSDASQMFLCRSKSGCLRGLDPLDEFAARLKAQSAQITGLDSTSTVSSTSPSASPDSTSSSVFSDTMWVRSLVRGIWKPNFGKYTFADTVYHRLNATAGDVSCSDPNDLACVREPFQYYGYMCKLENGCNTGDKPPGTAPDQWIELRPRYSNYRRRLNKDPIFVGRCSQCAKGFFKIDGECAKCPENPYLLLAAIICGFFAIGVAFYVLHTKDINVAILSIGVDYFQIVSLFSRARIAWPRAIKDLFRLFSFFNFNVDLAAPECIAVFEYDAKWMIIQSVPLMAISLMLIAVLWKFLIKSLLRYVVKTSHAQRGSRKLCRHAQGLIGLLFILIYYLYLNLTKYTLDIFNCNPTSPPEFENGELVTYLDATFEQCYVPGGMHERLVGLAVLALLMYTLGFPLLTAFFLYRHREEAFNDQLLRAQDIGKNRKENPQWETRLMFGKLYYMFKPRKFYWVIVIIFRKAAIAFTSLMFKKNPAFQLAMALLIMFTAYALQVLNRPYMSMVERADVIRQAELRGELRSIDRAVLRAREIETSRSKKNSLGMTKSFEQEEKRREKKKAARKAKAAYFFNYNTVETTLLGCGVLINLCGVMFSSSRFEESYYQGQQEFITYCAILIIIFSVLYYGCVCIAEIAAGTDFMKWIQWNLCCWCCPDPDRTRLRNLRKRRRRGEDVEDPMDHFVDDEGIEMAMQNPMMHSKANLEAQRAAEEKAKALSEQLEMQNQVNLKMAAAVRAAKKQSIGAGTRRRHGTRDKKKKKKKKLEFGSRKLVKNVTSTVSPSSTPSLSAGDSLMAAGVASGAGAPRAGATGAAGAAGQAGTAGATRTVPTQLPRGWRQSIDVVSGKPYFYKRETGQTTWARPTEASTVL
jgi:hypothetical protein